MASPSDTFLMSIVRKLEMENLKLIHERNSLQKQVLRLQRRLPLVAFGPIQHSSNEEYKTEYQVSHHAEPEPSHSNYRISLVESNGFSFYEYSSMSDSLEEYTLNAASTDKVRISSLPNSSSSSSSSSSTTSISSDSEYPHQSTDLFKITPKDLQDFPSSSSNLRVHHYQSDTNLNSMHKHIDSSDKALTSRSIVPPRIYISRREILPADRLLHRESSLGESTSTSNKMSPYITSGGVGEMETSLNSGGLSASLERSLFSADSAVKTHRKFSLSNEGVMGTSYYTIDESSKSPVWSMLPSGPLEVSTIPLERTSRVANELRALVKQVGIYTYVGGKVYLTQSKCIPDRKHKDMTEKGEPEEHKVPDPDKSLSSREGESVAEKHGMGQESMPRMSDVHWMRGGVSQRYRHQELSDTGQLNSGTSTSYYSPPDDPSSSSPTQSCIDSSPSKMRKAAPGAETPVNEEQTLWSGFIFKMSSKFKFWTRFWCQIHIQSLMLYKLRQVGGGEQQRPHRVIPLADVHSFHKSFHSSDYCTVEMIVRGKVHTFCGHTVVETLKFWRILHRSIRRCRAEEYLRQCHNLMTYRGWLRRIKQGHSKRLWCMLMSKYLIYFRTSTDTSPTGYKDLKDCTVKSFSESDPTGDNRGGSMSTQISVNTRASTLFDSDSEGFETSVVQKTIAIYDSNSMDPVYFVCANESEFQQWEQKLKMACQMSHKNLSMTSEKNFRDLLRNPEKVNVFFHETEPLSEPLLISTPTEFNYLAVNISRCLVSLSYPSKECQEREIKQEKVRLIQDIARMCFQEAQLKDEMYVQIIKQTRIKPTSLSRYRRTKLSLLCNISRSSSRGHFAASVPTSRGGLATVSSLQAGSASSEEPLSGSIRVMWECLCIFLSIFLPSPWIIEYMLNYFEEVIVTQPIDSDTAKYAHFALDQLNYIKSSHEFVMREEVPSYFEVNSISLRNPYTFSRPFSLPIYLTTGTYQVVSFDSLSKVAQIVDYTKSALLLDEVPEVKQIMKFGLYCSELDGREMLFLGDDWNMCDVICRYEMALSHMQRFASRPEEITLQFYFRIRWWRKAQLFLWLQTLSKEAMTDSKLEVVKLLLFQTQEDVFLNKYQISLEDKCRLSALFCQAIYGAWKSVVNSEVVLDRVLRQCVVSDMNNTSPDILQACLQTLREAWIAASNDASSSNKNAFFAYFEFLNSIAVDFFAARHFSAIADVSLNDKKALPNTSTSTPPATNTPATDHVINSILIPHSSCLVIHQLMTLPGPQSSKSPVLRQLRGRQVTSRRISLENIISFGGTHKDTSIFFVFSQGNTLDATLMKECYTLCTICHVTELLLTLKDFINF